MSPICGILKTLKNKIKILKIIKVDKINQNLIKDTFLLLKYHKTFDFLSLKSKNKFHVFLGAFMWNHPFTIFPFVMTWNS